MKDKKLVIIGTGETATLAYYYFTDDSTYEVVGFCVDKAFRDCDYHEGLPISDFETLTVDYPPSDYFVFVAFSSIKLNTIREKKYNICKVYGYKMASYISSHAYIGHHTFIGENCFIMEDNTIQPFVKIGDDVFMWSGNHIGHRCCINSHSFITSHVVVSGFTEIGKNCYIGVNATIIGEIKIGDYCLIGMGAIIHKSTPPYSIYKQEYAKKQSLNTKQFYDLDDL